MSRRTSPPASNPWLPSAGQTEQAAPAPAPPTYVSIGPQTPQTGVPFGFTGGLPLWSPDPMTPARWWWVGCHGGAGESTLSLAVEEGRDAGGRGWPVSASGLQNNVVLVTRTHAGGLQAAQTAARQWATGRLDGVNLLGLVAIADAPGKLPKSLQEWLKLVSGGVPRVWRVPWNESWRLGEWPDPQNSPRDVRKLASELMGLTTTRKIGG